MMHAATSKVENSAQGSSCKLKFVHAPSKIIIKQLFPFFKVCSSIIFNLGIINSWFFYLSVNCSSVAYGKLFQCKNALQKCTAKMHYKNALQKRTAKTHYKNALCKRVCKWTFLHFFANISTKKAKPVLTIGIMEQHIFCIFIDCRGQHRKGAAIYNAT